MLAAPSRRSALHVCGNVCTEREGKKKKTWNALLHFFELGCAFVLIFVAVSAHMFKLMVPGCYEMTVKTVLRTFLLRRGTPTPQQWMLLHLHTLHTDAHVLVFSYGFFFVICQPLRKNKSRLLRAFLGRRVEGFFFNLSFLDVNFVLPTEGGALSDVTQGLTGKCNVLQKRGLYNTISRPNLEIIGLLIEVKCSVNIVTIIK